jgi:hypothetical protein
MLGVLRPADWPNPALRGLDVQGLVGHLTGVEEDRALRGDPDVVQASHIGSTQAAADRQAGRPRPRPAPSGGARLTAPLPSSALTAIPATRSRCRACGCRWGMLLVARAFELWIHDNDIRHAVGLPPSSPTRPC